MSRPKDRYIWGEAIACPPPAEPLPDRPRPSRISAGSETGTQWSLRQRRTREPVENNNSVSEGGKSPDLSALGLLPDDTPLLLNLESFPLPPEVTSRRPSPLPAALSEEEQELDDLKAEQAGEELLLMWDKRDWRLSASSSELPCLPPSTLASPSGVRVVDLGDDSEDGHLAAGEELDRPGSPDVDELVESATPRFRRRRRDHHLPLDLSSDSSDELDLHTPLAETAVKHGIISPNSTLLSPLHASPTPRRRPKLTPRNSSAALRTGVAFTSGLGWSGSEDEQEIEDRAAYSAAVRMATPTGTPRFQLGVASSSHQSPPESPHLLSPTLLSPTVPSFSRRPSARTPPASLRVSTHRVSIQSHTSSVSTTSSSRMLATPPADPWGEFEIIRDPWDQPASPPAKGKPARQVSSGAPTATSKITPPSLRRTGAPLRIPIPERRLYPDTLPPLSPTGIPSPRRRSLFKPPDESRQKVWSALLE